MFILRFIFEAPASPIAEIQSWFPSSQNLKEIDSLNPLAIVCLFLNFTITFSLPQKILLWYENLLTSLLLTSKTIIGGGGRTT